MKNLSTSGSKVPNQERYNPGHVQKPINGGKVGPMARGKTQMKGDTGRPDSCKVAAESQGQWPKKK